jgi:hypothetical protein
LYGRGHRLDLDEFDIEQFGEDVPALDVVAKIETEVIFSAVSKPGREVVARTRVWTEVEVRLLYEGQLWSVEDLAAGDSETVVLALECDP